MRRPRNRQWTIGSSGVSEAMRIAIAMSGGVDSSTAAALLADHNPNSSAGSSPEVVGLTMQLWNQRRLPQLLGEESDERGHASGRCCSLDDVYDARAVANFLNIPYYVINLEKQFEAAVVRPFVEGYLAGETPIPCSLCNTAIKFADRKSTRLNSSHLGISYAVFCLKKKKQ